MADAWTLVATLGIDTGAYESGLAKAKNSAGGIGGVLRTAGKIGAAALGAATTAAVAFGGAAVKTGMEFDTSMSQVAATMGLTQEQMNEVGGTFEQLREYAQQMGSTTKYTATESAEALNFMALAGYDAETSMSMLPNVMNLASAGGMDLARASDMITDSQTALGLSIEETSALVDQMAKAASTGNTSVEQLGDAILTVGANAKVMQGGTVELSAALTALADNGIKGSEGGTKLRNVLLGIQNAKFDKTFGALGVSAYDASGELRALPDILSDMNDVMSDMTQAEKTDLINKTFNKADLAAVNALLDTSTDRWEDLTTAIEDSSGAAQTMADVQLDNLAGDVTLFKSALDGIKIAISDEITPSLREFTQFGTESLATLTEAFKEGGLSGAMDALGNILSQGLTMVIGKLPDMISAGMQLLGALGQGLLDNLPLIIESAQKVFSTILDGLIVGIPKLLEAGVQLLGMLAQGIADALPTLIPTITSVVLRIAQILIDNIGVLINSAIAIIEALVEGIMAALPRLISQAPKIINSLMKAIMSNLPKLLRAGLEIIVMLVNGITENIPVLIEMIPELVTSILDAIVENLPVLIEAALEIVMTLANGIIEAIPTLVEAIPTLISGLVSAITENLPTIIEAGITLLTSLIEGIISMLPELIPAAIEMVMTITQSLIDNLPLLIDAAIQIMLALSNGIIENISLLIEAIPQVISSLVDAIIANLPQIIQMGIQLIVSLVSGIVSSIPQVVSSIGQMITRVVSALSQSMSKFLQKGGEIVTKIASGIGQSIAKVPQKIGELIKKAKAKFTSTDWKKVGSDLIDGIKNGVINAATRLVSAAKDVVNRALTGVKNLLGIASPSKVAARVIGKPFSEGIGVGFVRNFPISQMVGAVADALGEIEDLEPPTIGAGFDDDVVLGSLGSEEYGAYSRPQNEIVINVYPSEGMDEVLLARKVEDVIGRQMRQRGMVFA